MSAPCVGCGADTSNILEIRGRINDDRYVCAACISPALAEFWELQRQFDEMISAGVSREQANRIMIDRIDGAAPS